MCFTNAPGNKKQYNFSSKEDKFELDDFSVLFGQKQKPDLVNEMIKAEAE